MSLEGTIREMGLQEIGQLLALTRKSGVLVVRSRLRGVRSWMRFAEGGIVDAGEGDPPPDGSCTGAAVAGRREAVEEMALDLLAWREGSFSFVPTPSRTSEDSRVRIATDSLLVESARREDAWRRVRDRVPSADAVPTFVDVEPKSLPLLHLVPQEWELLTRVDGERDLRTLATLLEREVVEVAALVHGLVGTGVLTVRDGTLALRPTPLASPTIVGPAIEAWSTETAVTLPAPAPVASTPIEPSCHVGDEFPRAAVCWRTQGDEAARRGEFETALDRWSRYLRAHERAADADRVREAVGLTARLHALLGQASHE